MCSVFYLNPQMAKDIDFFKRGKYGLHIRKFLLLPEFWSDPTKQIKIKSSDWKCVSFDLKNKTRVSSNKGLYAFVLKPSYPGLFETNYLLYIGKTNRTLQERFVEYIKEKDGKNKYRFLVKEMLQLYEGHIYFYFSELTSTEDIDLFEEILLNTFVPFVNTEIPEAKINDELKYIYKSF